MVPENVTTVPVKSFDRSSVSPAGTATLSNTMFVHDAVAEGTSTKVVTVHAVEFPAGMAATAKAARPTTEEEMNVAKLMFAESKKLTTDDAHSLQNLLLYLPTYISEPIRSSLICNELLEFYCQAKLS